MLLRTHISFSSNFDIDRRQYSIVLVLTCEIVFNFTSQAKEVGIEKEIIVGTRRVPKNVSNNLCMSLMNYFECFVVPKQVNIFSPFQIIFFPTCLGQSLMT